MLGFTDGFKFGLGFFSAGVVFWIIVAILGGILGISLMF